MAMRKSDQFGMSWKQQDSQIRTKLEQNYPKDMIYRTTSSYTGFGVSSQFRVQKNDIVALVKNCDPCGNTSVSQHTHTHTANMFGFF
jgi:hypothetical protein